MADLSERDREILVMAWKCFKSPPEVDYKQLQELGGYKTTASASTVYCQVKNKLLGNALEKLSARDREILVLAWKCFKSPPQVDYKKLQELGGYKTTASASTVYCQVKNKLLGTNGGAKGASKRKKAMENGEEAAPAPKKRARKATSETSGDGVAAKSKTRAKKIGISNEDTKGLEDDHGTHPDPDHTPEHRPTIKHEPHDEPVDMSLFAQAAQLLDDYEAENDDLI